MIAKRLGSALLLAFGLIALAGGLRYLAGVGVIDERVARRAVQVVIGLGLAVYANMMPKRLGRLSGSLEAQARAQTALRIAGWSMALAGLAYAGLWAAAPLAVADTGCVIVVGTAMAVTLGYAVWAFAACRFGRPSASAR